MNGIVSEPLGQFVVASPLVLVWLLALVVALRRWNRDRRPALCVIAGIALMALGAVGSLAAARWSATSLTDTRLASINFANALVWGAAQGLILIGVFIDRPPARRSDAPAGDDAA